MDDIENASHHSVKYGVDLEQGRKELILQHDLLEAMERVGAAVSTVAHTAKTFEGNFLLSYLLFLLLAHILSYSLTYSLI